MSKYSNIQWTNSSNNFWEGCDKVSPGCKFCYAERMFNRFGKDFSVVRRTSDKNFYAPLKWKEPALVFTCSTSDFFIKDADDWRSDAWGVIRATPHLTYQILTKRPERIMANLPSDWGRTGYQNVWLGVSVEDDNYKSRYKILNELKSEHSIFKTFVSYEPALGFLDISTGFENLDWLIVGGESGNNTGKHKFRECKLQYIESIVGQCKAAGIPVFVKQLGTYLSQQRGMSNRHGDILDEFPLSLQYREFPINK